jgi:Zn finger protein HypA/HybF involved in hydrogenase expression
MRVGIAHLAALLLTVFLISSVSPVLGQDGEHGDMRIDVEMVSSGVNSVDGSGSFRLTYSGEAATFLREGILTAFNTNDDDLLDPGEAEGFLVALSDVLMGKLVWGLAIDGITDFGNASDNMVRDHLSGVVYTEVNSTSAVVVSMDFDASGGGSSKLMQLSRFPVDTFSDAVGSVIGYYHEGTMTVKSRLIMVGIGSFTNPDMVSGKVSELRTPLGTVVWYSYHGDMLVDGELVDETLTYKRFSILENQQIAFVVVLIGMVLIIRQPMKRFRKYKLLHPRRFRKYAKLLPAATYISYALAAFVLLLYLVPYLFSGGSQFLLYSSYLYFIIPAAVFVQFFMSKAMYDHAAAEIPEDTVVEVKQALIETEKVEELLCQVCFSKIDLETDLFRCPGCGLEMHGTCAEKSQGCPSCSAVLFPERTRSIQCKACGETFLYSGMEDEYSIQCTRCGAFQEDVKSGRNYMVLERDPSNAYSMARAMGLSDRPVMVLTSNFPGKIRGEHDLGDNIEVKWFSDSTTDIDNVNPRDLDGDVMEISSTFLMTTKRSGVVVDGLDMLIKENDFETALAFIKRLNDLAAIHGATIILALDKNSVTADQFKAVSDEFDEIHDYQ